MHELAICQALIREVQAVAAANGARSVTDIHVSVGPLSGAEPPLLRNAFPFAAAGTVAGEARLHLHETPIRVCCGGCGATTEAAVNRLVCGACGDWQTSLLGGDELLLSKVSMQTNDSEER